MKVEFRKSFINDLKRIRQQLLKEQVRNTIELVEKAQGLQEIKSIKKLKEGERYYRIRMGDYRLGLVLESESLIFVRFLPRKDLYRYFP